jgi:hypothetical protein
MIRLFLHVRYRHGALNLPLQIPSLSRFATDLAAAYEPWNTGASRAPCRS